jgi:NAD(P)-dependent dehydrogenase (short-subunit alcohol dehydrogenase family)
MHPSNQTATPESAPSANVLGLAPPPGSRVLVAGGCGGVGRPMVQACQSIGLDVAVLALPSSIDRNPPPDGVLTVPADATDEASVSGAFEKLRNDWGSIDVLIFLVGFLSVPPAEIPDVAPQTWDEVLTGNLRSAFLVCREALPFLHEAGGAIVNVGSSLAYNPLKGVSAYAAEKVALSRLQNLSQLKTRRASVQIWSRPAPLKHRFWRAATGSAVWTRRKRVATPGFSP